MEPVLVISDPKKVAEYLAPLVAQQLAAPAHETKKLVTITEAKELYGLNRTSIWQLRREGKLKNYGHGKTVRLSVDEILKLNS